MTKSQRNELIKNFTNNITVNKNMPDYGNCPTALQMLEDAKEFIKKSGLPKGLERKLKRQK